MSEPHQHLDELLQDIYEAGVTEDGDLAVDLMTQVLHLVAKLGSRSASETRPPPGVGSSPRRIWLQWGDPDGDTWCDHRIHHTDVEYLRADLWFFGIPAGLEALAERAAQLRGDIPEEEVEKWAKRIAREAEDG